MRQLLFALCLAPSAAAAQDLIFDMTPTLDCLARAVTVDEQNACVGTSAGVCMSANDMGSTTIGMSGCMDRELTYWDDRLNGSYRMLMTQERAQDAESAGLPGAASQADALRAMQRAWIAFRDATCDYERAQWGGGTGGGPATVGCLMRLTGQQTLYLEQMARSF